MGAVLPSCEVAARQFSLITCQPHAFLIAAVRDIALITGTTYNPNKGRVWLSATLFLKETVNKTPWQITSHLSLITYSFSF